MKTNKMKAVELKKVKKGEFFRTTENGPVWVRGYYYAPEKVFECYKFEDVNHEHFFNGSKSVFVGFEF